MVCYKETHANAVIDPQDPPTWTGTWRDPRFSPPADGGRPENGLQATIFMVNGPNPQSMEVQIPQADGQMRFWRNTSVATQAPGASYSTDAKLLGYKWDTDEENGFRPAGTFHLSTATYTFGSDGPYLLDYGSTFGAGTATHHASMYRYVNGSTSSLVFGSGTTQWAWALDGTHDGGPTTPDVNLQQATVNLLADMGAQPATLQGALTPATASSDRTPPTSTITSPAAGSTVQARTVVSVVGKAADAGGGTVGGVEVSVDGGLTWHPANGRESWTYTWSPPTIGTATIRSRAVDDSGNLETPSAGVTITITSSGGISIWGAGATPGTVAVNDPAAVELGVKFTADTGGFIAAIRFFKSSTNTGTHRANLWTSGGTLLGTGTFANESASGWQEYAFPSPIAISAGATYVASYFAPNGHYSADINYFTSSYDNPPLHAPATATSGNGVYAYSPVSTFPSSTYMASNYWVDVVFTTSNGGGGGGGGGGGSGTTNSIWGAGATPGTVAVNDPAAVELGVKFTADTGGFIAAIRFFKSSTNTGTHRANLWTSGGTLLGTGTFANESASGWQEYAFPSPIAISAGATYVASYFAPNGHYSADINYFTSSYDNPPLHAPATATSGNGVYAYSPVSTFPSSTYMASNYWVDVVFASGGAGTTNH